MSWFASGTAWSALIELIVDNVDEDNGNIRRSFATLVNKLMMTASCYKSGKSMITAANYKSRFDACHGIRVVNW